MSTPSKPSFLESLARRFFEDRRLLILSIALIVVAGLSSLAIMPRMEDPVLTPRAAFIVTRLPGADAERVESLVTEKIESALRDVEEIDELSSSSRAGISTISVELKQTIYETDAIWARVRGKVEDAIALLPPEASRPSFEEAETSAYALILGVVWNNREAPADHRVLRRVAIDLQDRIQNVSGTEVVDRFGDPGEEIEVEIDPVKAASLGLSLDAIAEQVNRYDAKSSAGQLRGESVSLLIDIDNQLEAVSMIENIPVASRDGKDVRLAEVAQVSMGMPDPLPRFANLNGREAVVLGAMVTDSTQINGWTETTEEMLNDYERRLPDDVALDRLMVQNDYVAARMQALRSNLILGASGVALVIFFMMGWRSALIVTLALPLSSLMVLFGMRVYSIPIHQMSVTGLIIAFGLLIDNAIVVVDEVKGRLRKGDAPTDAMVGSVKHLAVPLLGSTLTTAFAFAPIALMPGGGGEFVGAIAIAVIMAISASFVLAITVLPTLAARLVAIRPEETVPQHGPVAQFFRDGFHSNTLSSIYEAFIRQCVQRPALGVVTGLVLPVSGFYLASTLREQFFPPCDRNQFHIQVDLPMTASIAETRSTSDKIDQFVRNLGAQRIDWFYGESAPEFYYNVVGDRKGQPNYAQAIVTLAEGENPKNKIRELQRTLDESLVAPRILVRQLEQGPPFEAPVEIRLFGPNLDELRRLGDEVRRRLINHPDVVAVRSDLNEVLPQLSVNVDPSVAASAGIGPSQVARQLSTTLEGVRGGNVIQDNEELPVVVRVSDQERSDLARIESLDLVLDRNDASQEARLTPIGAISTIGLKPESAAIPRLNRQRMNEISVYITAGILPSVVQSFIEQSIESDPLGLPAGYSIAFGGESGERDESVGNLMSTVGLLFVLMIATLVLSFGSFRMAAIIGLVGMLSIGLSLLALAIGGYPFGFISIIGTMGLLGVAINDSIVVLAGIRTNKRACEGDVEETVFEIMHATRHVLATTVTTIAGFAPLIIAGGDFWPPLAVAISGGVAGASVLALVLVPALHHWAIASRSNRPSLSSRLLASAKRFFVLDEKTKPSRRLSPITPRS
ncbi:MAG: efflux RND transporter permease subunit [Planctomycetota bacterium]